MAPEVLESAPQVDSPSLARGLKVWTAESEKAWAPIQRGDVPVSTRRIGCVVNDSGAPVEILGGAN